MRQSGGDSEATLRSFSEMSSSTLRLREMSQLDYISTLAGETPSDPLIVPPFDCSPL
ncbi:MAG: hypothetical protein ACI9G1_004779 [Pirellulaceae bacterium]